ncbi:MAG: molybdenum transporter, periplasmic molybdate-binding protein [Solirubrobacterales bacterium]|nr:molybdenum transporter, periplasmic molybdate-binding protein [Solirubrobacterales bacterium]
MCKLGTVLLAAAAVLAGCGSSGKSQIKVSAATSLKSAFTKYGGTLEGMTASFSFAGSDMLAAQIQQGVKPDVFASANSKLPDQLYAKGLVEKPVRFATNRLVLAVPAGSSKVKGLADLTRSGVTIAIGSATVPIGSYTRKVLTGLPPAQSKAILGHVRSNEPDVGGVVGKLTQGAVDAGFVYVTDADAAAGKITAIPLPARLQPDVVYEVAVVKGTKHAKQADAFVSGLLTGAGRADLLAAGFRPPPSG